MKDLERELAILNNLETEVEPVKKDDGKVVFNGRVIDTEDNNSLLSAVLESTFDDKRKADDLYRMFEERLNYNKDNTDASKQALTEAVNARNQASTNLIKLVETKFRYMNKEADPLVNINLSQRRTGIDLNNIEDALKDL